jgi:hypothetical protein
MFLKSKYQDFVKKLEQQMLDEKQESIVVIGLADEQSLLGEGTNRGGCANGASSCDGSVNTKSCINANDNNCRLSINKKVCSLGQ